MKTDLLSSNQFERVVDSAFQILSSNGLNSEAAYSDFVFAAVIENSFVGEQ